MLALRGSGSRSPGGVPAEFGSKAVWSHPQPSLLPEQLFYLSALTPGAALAASCPGEHGVAYWIPAACRQEERTGCWSHKNTSERVSAPAG